MIPFIWSVLTILVSVGSLCSEIVHKNKWYYQPLETKINSFPTNHPQGVGVVVVCAAFRIVFTGCTKRGREGRAGSVCFGSRFKYQQKWRHPTSLIPPLSRERLNETFCDPWKALWTEKLAKREADPGRWVCLLLPALDCFSIHKTRITTGRDNTRTLPLVLVKI